MSAALLVEYYTDLPERLPGEKLPEWRGRLHKGQEAYKKKVLGRYTEGTLTRLLDSGDVRARRAALLALSLIGSMAANETCAARLHDEDAEVRRMAADTLWALWFHAGSAEHNHELQRVLRVRDREKAVGHLDKLLGKAPEFAEAYNQRAILRFSLKQYDRSVADCERALELNPFHFGAQAGMGQCFLQLRKPKAALKAFRNALRINPNLDSIAETVKALESTLGEEGRKDDKK